MFFPHQQPERDGAAGVPASPEGTRDINPGQQDPTWQEAMEMAKFNEKQAKLVIIKAFLSIFMSLMQYLSCARASQTHSTQGTFYISTVLFLGKEPSFFSFCFSEDWEFPKANQMP